MLYCAASADWHYYFAEKNNISARILLTWF